ncbi:MAG TPA: 3-deoxy-D-manno-octulosonic acid transferase [Vicinamibacteria bacterium]
MYFLYSVLLAVGFVLVLPFYLWRDRVDGRYRRTFAERMGRLPEGLRSSGTQGSIWVHAVSVGEVLAARPLVDALKLRLPARDVFLSTTTPTGHAVAQRSVRGTDGLFFAPFDWAGPVRAALDRLDPALLVLVETEIWPNLIHEARRRGVRVAMVNGRISERSHRGYARIRPLLRRILSGVDLFLMQGDAHAERIRDLGAPGERVRVSGNLKFDLEVPQTSDALAALLRREGPLVVAGSTLEGEEAAVLAAFQEARTRVPSAWLLIAPRHPERFDVVPALVREAGLRCVRRSVLEPGAASAADVVLLDSLGELAQVYALASAVFVGGSLVPKGGHNILEPAVLGKPVIVGPHMENFREIAEAFRAEGALVQVSDVPSLARELTILLTDEGQRSALGQRGRAVVERNRGAVAFTIDALAGLLA